MIIKFEKSRILPPSELTNLAHSLDLPTFRQRILKFFPELTNKIFPDLDSLHNYFRDDQILTNWKILKNSPDSIFDFLKALFLLEFEVENIKTIIKSKYLEVGYEKISRDVHILVEKILGREDLFNNFIHLNNLTAGFELFKHSIYYPALKKAEKYYENFKSLAFYDICLDRTLIKNAYDCFTDLKMGDRKVIGEYMELFMEYYNLKTLIRGINLGFRKDFLTNVLLSKNRLFRTLLKFDTVREMIDFILTNRSYSKFFHFPQTTNIETILTHFRDSYHQFCLKLIKKWKERDVFGITSPFSFLLMKQFEIEDLKFISIGIDYGLDPEKIVENTILCNFK